MQTSGFAELSDFQAPAQERAVRSPGLLGLVPALFSRRSGGRVQNAVMLMAAPVTCRARDTRTDDPRQVAHEMRMHWGMNS
jgi:hypothetical protein